LNNEFLVSLADKFGTPLYVYDSGLIRRQYRRLAAAFSDLDCRLFYACKANSNPHIIRILHEEGAGIDCVSIDEVRLAMRCGYSPSQILFTPNSIGIAELSEVAEMGVQINIDSLGLLEAFGLKYGAGIPVCLRLNPHIAAGGNPKIQTGHIDSKFGISVLQRVHLLKIVRHYGLKVNGLHIHTGSEFLDSAVFLMGAQVLFDTAADLPDLEFLDFGSGFKVAYHEEDPVTDVEDLGKRLSQACQEFFAEYGRPLQIRFEPGKFLVSEAGALLARVQNVKVTPASVFVGVDTGLNHLIRPMMYDSYHQIHNISAPEAPLRVCNVVGNICETDTLGYDRRMPEPKEGHVLAIRNAGAYGYSMASPYNLRGRPAEVLVDGASAHLIRRRETLDDILAGVLE
jgi:diaminopimelate decarboxylase